MPTRRERLKAFMRLKSERRVLTYAIVAIAAVAVLFGLLA